MPFAPEIVIDSVRHAIESLRLKGHSPYGFDASFNPTFPEKQRNPHGWVSPWIFGLNQGPIVLMIENFQSRVVWDMRAHLPVHNEWPAPPGFYRWLAELNKLS